MWHRGSEVAESTADWLTMRSSSEGGSKNTQNGSPSAPSASRWPSVGACSASISVVNTSAPSRASAACRRSGSRAWAPSVSTAQSAEGSSFHVAVAKCSATRGENVQSSSRVGSPWC